MDHNSGDQSQFTRQEHNKVKSNQLSTERNMSTAATVTETSGTSSVSSGQTGSPSSATLRIMSSSTIHANISVKVEDESIAGQTVQHCKRVKKEEQDKEYLVMECDCEEDRVKMEFKEEIVETSEELKEELREELREELKKELSEELKEELSEELREELKKELREELKKELSEELKKELREELKKELRKELKKELREELKEEIVEHSDDDDDCDCSECEVQCEVKRERKDHSHRKKGARVKREIEQDCEMTLQNGQDNAPQNQQIGDCVKQEIKEYEDGEIMDIKEVEEEDDEGEDEINANVNTSFDIDTLMRDEVELGEPTRTDRDREPVSHQTHNAHSSLANASTSSNEAQSNLTNQEDDNEDHLNRSTPNQFDETNNNGGMMEEEEEEVGDGQTRVTDTDDLAANEGANEESSLVEDSQIGTTLAQLTGQKTLAIVRQSARLVKRKQTEQVNYQEDMEEDEDGQVGDESSRQVKKPRMDSTQPNNSIREENATESPTEPIQPSLHQSNRHFQCPHCHKSFIHNSKLQRHLRVHTDERPFACEQCDKRFKERSALAKHQLIHQNIKSFQCDQCEKQFTRKNHLDIHLLVHSGQRPFACRHCAESFAHLTTRNNHEQAIHLHVKPYRCKQCGLTATQRGHVIGHIRVVHFGLPRTIKQQRELNIIDERDPGELVENV